MCNKTVNWITVNCTPSFTSESLVGGVGSMADWDADDFEPDVPATVTVPKVTDKWEGEDEDDDVKVISYIFCNLHSCS